MNKKIFPYLFLILLALALLFILGVRYGQKVEKTNKTVDLFLSLPPTQTPKPTQPPLTFQTYKNSVCGMQFLYPTTLTKEKETSTSASFYENKKSILEISCERDEKIISLLEDKNIATLEINLQNKKLVAKNRQNDLIFKIINQKTNREIFVMIKKSLYALFANTIQFFN